MITFVHKTLKPLTTVEYNAEKYLSQHGFCVLDINSQQFPAYSRPVMVKHSLVAFCLQGSARYELNMEPMNMTTGMCVCYPHVILMRPVDCSSDFKAQVMLLRDDIAMDSVAGIETSLLQDLIAQPVAYIGNKQEWHLFGGIMNNLRCLNDMLQLRDEPSLLVRQIITAQFRSMVLLLCHHTLNHDSDNAAVPVYTSADNYFRQFVVLIDKHVKQEHEVAFYARQLNITSKYLSIICNNKTQLSAKDIITNVLVQRIKNELILSGKAIKELADEYGFASQSSFGKFFRKATGLSPLAYRNSSYGLPTSGDDSPAASTHSKSS